MNRVHISVKEYRGKDPVKKQNYHDQIAVARAMEQFINKRLENQGGGPITISYDEISRAISAPLNVVKELGFRTQGGSNGLTY